LRTKLQADLKDAPMPETATANSDQVAYWNAAAGETWTAMQDKLDNQIQPLGEAAIEALGLNAGDTVVDVGCGCGQTTAALARRVGAGGSVLGVDVSRPMLAAARHGLAAQGLAQARVIEADAQTHAFAPAAFDAVFSRFGVMFFDDPRAAFANLRSALLPTGRLSFVCWRSLSDNPWMNVAYEAVRPLVPDAVATPPGDAPGPLAFADPARVKAILEGAGFHRASLEPVDHPMSLGENRGLEAAAREAITLGPVSRILAEASDGLREKAVAVVRKALEPYQRGSVVELTGAAWVVVASA
jgi:SAM-dependent methyltransferase